MHPETGQDKMNKDDYGGKREMISHGKEIKVFAGNSNPELAEQGKNPFVLDSKEPDWSKFREFLMKEVRYTSLLKTFPAEAEELFEAAEENAKWRYAGYQRLSKMEY